MVDCRVTQSEKSQASLGKDPDMPGSVLKRAALDNDKSAGYSHQMELPMKRLWRVGFFLVLLVGAVWVRHAGRTDIFPQNQQVNRQEAPALPPEAKADAKHEADAALPRSAAVTGAASEEAPHGRLPQPQPEASLVEAQNRNPPTAPPLLAEPASSAGDPAEDAAREEVVKGTVEKGDTVSKILEGAGGEGVYQYVSAARQVFSMRSFREGQPYVIITDAASGRVKRFEYEIDASRRLVVEGIDEPVARVEAIDYITLLGSVEGAIDDNLFQAVADAGESPQMALQLAELFGAEINFIRDLQQGDSFSVLVEKRYRDGEYKGYGRILAAHFTNKGKTFEAYLFRDGNSKAQYYNRRGENLHKTLLQAPLAFTRLTSRFTMRRKHPILGYTRPHMGVDYGAPTGTPVKAVGDGVVTKRGWGGGYGNQIIVKHVAGLESMYSHLSGYARGLRQGQKVRQGQVIGFVGSTGLATGPHLDFRLRQNGKFINPTQAVNPRSAPISKKRRAEFEKVMAQELAYLKGQKSLAEYTVESVVPEKIVLTENAPENSEDQKTEPRRKRRRG